MVDCMILPYVEINLIHRFLGNDKLVFINPRGPLLILQEPFKLGRLSGISQQRGIQGEGREEGLGAYPGHGQSLRSLRQAVLLPRLLHLIYCLLKTLYLPRRIPGEWAAGFEYL